MYLIVQYYEVVGKQGQQECGRPNQEGHFVLHFQFQSNKWIINNNKKRE